MIAEEDTKYMARAIELARKGAGFVSPNPLVGCVIVKDGKIVAEGYHKKFGGPHAERIALGKIKNQKSKIKTIGATIYINLEPCVHYGKTAPCIDALIAAKVKRVVIGMPDPNPLVAGKGIRKLRQAGIEVTTDVLSADCRELNHIFCKWITTRQPFVLLKCAVTLDGALTFKRGTRSEFSSPESYVSIHELRQEYDAIGLGVGSVIIDDPLLTTRRKQASRNPLRVIFDTHLRIPAYAQLLQQPGRTIIFTSKKFVQDKKARLEKFSGVRVVPVAVSKDGRVDLRDCLDWLGKEGIASIMVEGGAAVADSFLAAGLADQLIFIVTPQLSLDQTAPRLFQHLDRPVRFASIRHEIHGVDMWLIGSLA